MTVHAQAKTIVYPLLHFFLLRKKRKFVENNIFKKYNTILLPAYYNSLAAEKASQFLGRLKSLN